MGDRETRRAFVEVPDLNGRNCVRAVCSRWTTFVEVDD